MLSFLKPSVLLASCFITYQGASKDFQVYNLFGKKKDTPKHTKSYIWGNGFYYARPGAAMQFKNFEPKLIKNISGEKDLNFKQFGFGEFHEGGIDLKGDFYVWPKHKLDASFSNDGDQKREALNLLDNTHSVKQIAFSKGWIWALRENGEVYQWQVKVEAGNEDAEDVDNLKVEVNKTPRKIDDLKNVVQIATGEDHFIALDKEGQVWAMGDDTYGN